MTDRLGMRGPLDGLLTGLLPIPNRLRMEPRLCIVPREQFRLGGSERRKLLLQHLRDAAMIPLSRTPEQGRIGGVLD
jgi:hypothetical protein